MSGHSQHGSALVLRPSLPRYLQAFRSATLLLGVVVVVLFLRGGAVGALAAIVVAALGSSVMSLYFRRAKVAVTPDKIVSTGLIRTRRTPRSAVESVVTAAMPRSHPASKTFPHLFVLNRDGRCVARLKGTHWLEEDMRLLIRQLGLAPRKLGRVTNAKQLAASYPRAVSVLERHRTVAGLLIAGPVVAAIVITTIMSTD